MAGHSKWANTKHRKARVDAQRGKLFTKLIREVNVSTRLGGGDPDANPRLRSAIQEARSSNVPADNIDRAIKKATGELDGPPVEEIMYEGYGPGGVAVLVEAFTDNRNRTSGEVRHVFSRFGGNLGETGCVGWMFDRRGYFNIEPANMDEEKFMEFAIENDAQDFSVEEDGFELYTDIENYNRTLAALEVQDIQPNAARLTMVPQNSVEVDEERLPTVIRLLEGLEDLDDVQNVWANFDADPEVLARVSEQL
jgi:YebC/PmpR family DNA-binding regulatory protein